MNALILLRGLPGAGKTTLTKLLCEEERYPVYSVDDYFESDTGAYVFKFDENHLAYKQCMSNTESAMIRGDKKIFVHNTFTMDWEIEPYVLLAKKHGYALHVLTVENYHNSKNVHDVSDEQIKKMAEKYKVKLF